MITDYPRLVTPSSFAQLQPLFTQLGGVLPVPRDVTPSFPVPRVHSCPPHHSAARLALSTPHI